MFMFSALHCLFYCLCAVGGCCKGQSTKCISRSICHGLFWVAVHSCYRALSDLVGSPVVTKLDITMMTGVCVDTIQGGNLFQLSGTSVRNREFTRSCVYSTSSQVCSRPFNRWHLINKMLCERSQLCSIDKGSAPSPPQIISYEEPRQLVRAVCSGRVGRRSCASRRAERSHRGGRSGVVSCDETAHSDGPSGTSHAAATTRASPRTLCVHASLPLVWAPHSLVIHWRAPRATFVPFVPLLPSTPPAAPSSPVWRNGTR